MCPNYDYERRVRKRALEQQREVEELQRAEDESNLREAFDETYSDEFLLEHGVPEMVESWEQSELEARCDMLKFAAGSLSLKDMA